MTPEQMRDNDVRALAEEVSYALGVNGTDSTEQIMEHAISQACLELAVVEHVLEAYETSKHQDLVDLRYLVSGIRARLSLTQNGSRTLDRIINNKPWDLPNGLDKGGSND